MTETTAPRLLVPKRVVKPTTWGGKADHFTNGGVVVYSTAEEAQADADKENARLAAEMFARLDPASLAIPGTERLCAMVNEKDARVRDLEATLSKVRDGLLQWHHSSAAHEIELIDAVLPDGPKRPVLDPDRKATEREMFERAHLGLMELVTWNDKAREYQSGSGGLGWQQGLRATEFLCIWERRGLLADEHVALFKELLAEALGSVYVDAGKCESSQQAKDTEALAERIEAALAGNMDPCKPGPLVLHARSVTLVQNMVKNSRGQDSIARGYLTDILHALTNKPLVDCQ